MADTKELVFDPLPPRCSRDDRITQNVGALKDYLAENTNCRLRYPIYHACVKFFDTAHPIAINYGSNGGKTEQLYECMGNVHAVCLYTYDNPENEDESTLVRDGSGRMLCVGYKTPVPLRRGTRKPVNDAEDLLEWLRPFDDTLFIVMKDISSVDEIDASDAHMRDFQTYCYASTCLSYWDGYGWNYTYSNDGTCITGRVIGDGRDKIDLDGDSMPDMCPYRTHEIIYTNVIKTVADERRARLATRRQEWAQYLSARQAKWSETSK